MAIVPIPQTFQGAADLALGVYDALKVLRDLVDYEADCYNHRATEQRLTQIAGDARRVIEQWNYLAKPEEE